APSGLGVRKKGGSHVEQSCSGVGRGSHGPAASGLCGRSAAHCAKASMPKHAAEAHQGKWIELTSDQWQFLRGIRQLKSAKNRPRAVGSVKKHRDGFASLKLFSFSEDRECSQCDPWTLTRSRSSSKVRMRPARWSASPRSWRQVRTDSFLERDSNRKTRQPD